MGANEILGVTLVLMVAMWIIFQLQKSGLVIPEQNWKSVAFDNMDALSMMSAMIILTIISWLANREITGSFKRIKALSHELQQERDSLEIQVQERTNELKEYQLKQLMKVNTLAEFGKLSAGLLHDIKNPLSVIALNLDSLKNKTKENDLVDKTIAAVKMVNSTIKFSLNQVLRREDEEKDEFEVRDLIANTIILVQHQADRRQAKINFITGDSIRVMGYPVRLSQVIANILINALEADAKEIKITCSLEGEKLVLTIEDNGKGMTKAVMARVFEPLFSTKKDDQRSGLGLYISQKIISDYFHGNIEIKSKAGQGSTFIISFPIV